MARRRSRTVQRDVSIIPTQSVLDFSPLADLLAIEDRRQWHPEEPFEPARSARSLSDSFVVADPVRPTKRQAPGRPLSISADVFRFKVPDNVAVCIRRKERREVLFAKRKTGKGSRKRFRRRNYYTEVSCR